MTSQFLPDQCTSREGFRFVPTKVQVRIPRVTSSSMKVKHPSIVRSAELDFILTLHECQCKGDSGTINIYNVINCIRGQDSAHDHTLQGVINWSIELWSGDGTHDALIMFTPASLCTIFWTIHWYNSATFACTVLKTLHQICTLYTLGSAVRIV